MYIHVRCVFPTVSRHAIGSFTYSAIRKSMNYLTVAVRCAALCAAVEMSPQATHLKALQFGSTHIRVPGLIAALSKVADFGSSRLAYNGGALRRAEDGHSGCREGKCNARKTASGVVCVFVCLFVARITVQNTRVIQ
jgi:hypothetical protein